MGRLPGTSQYPEDEAIVDVMMEDLDEGKFRSVWAAARAHADKAEGPTREAKIKRLIGKCKRRQKAATEAADMETSPLADYSFSPAAAPTGDSSVDSWVPQIARSLVGLPDDEKVRRLVKYAKIRHKIDELLTELTAAGVSMTDPAVDEAVRALVEAILIELTEPRLF